MPDRLRDAWPYLLFDEAFPISTSLVNAALDGATVARAEADQLPLAREVKPRVVAIWLGIDDLAQHTPVAHFSSELRALIEELRATGAQRILVADLPRAFGSGVTEYDTAIRSVVESTERHLRRARERGDIAGAGSRLGRAARRSEPPSHRDCVRAGARAALIIPRTVTT